MNNFNSSFFHRSQKFRRRDPASRLHETNSLLDDHIDDTLVVRWHTNWEQRDIYTCGGLKERRKERKEGKTEGKKSNVRNTDYKFIRLRIVFSVGLPNGLFVSALHFRISSRRASAPLGGCATVRDVIMPSPPAFDTAAAISAYPT
tara:strand:+ start:227 stop:664 length:438 start_codon:yes stop_codon:yes gene_type:complete